MGISIIGLAISRATNQPFIDLIFENILYPLDMKNSFYLTIQHTPTTDNNFLNNYLYCYKSYILKLKLKTPYKHGVAPLYYLTSIMPTITLSTAA